MNVIGYCALLMVNFQLSFTLAPHELTFLIISQNDSVSASLANELKNNILHQIRIEAFLNNNEIESVQQPKIILSHESFNSVGSWAITPILASSTEYIDNLILSHRNVRRSSSSNGGDLQSPVARNATPHNSENGEEAIVKTPSTEPIETKWLILCEDQSIVDLKALINNLKNEDYTKDIFLGYPLRDSEATIIHHFAFFDENPSSFLYPLFRAGVAISIPLLKKLSERVRNERILSDFFIDASHEMALFAWNNGKGHKLTDASTYFCLERKSTKSTVASATARAQAAAAAATQHQHQQPSHNEDSGCAIYSRHRDDSISHNHLYSVGSKITDATIESSSSMKSTVITSNNVLFAVKTWSKNHAERIPIIQQTWAKEAKFIRYYSDEADLSIPTISTNVENTETGHCAKTIVIFEKVWQEIATNKHLNQIKYVVLCDDDTLFSVSTLVAYLRHFNANADVYLGERYGYQLLSPNGFNYITGGGGIVFSLSVIEKLVENCRCPTAASPDDMIIALCLQRFGIEPVHSSRFHQARPIDYPEEVLLNNKPISFHKFWQIDPFYVYENWLRDYKDTKREEKNKYKYELNRNGKKNHCSKNQNEFCHTDSYNENN